MILITWNTIILSWCVNQISLIYKSKRYARDFSNKLLMINKGCYFKTKIRQFIVTFYTLFMIISKQISRICLGTCVIIPKKGYAMFFICKFLLPFVSHLLTVLQSFQCSVLISFNILNWNYDYYFYSFFNGFTVRRAAWV